MISKRLNKIVEFVDFNKNVADIGSDHGYVLIELRKRGFNNLLLGVENKKEPYKRLELNLKANKLDNVSISLSSGLNAVTKEFNSIIIAGMGFETIKAIINDDKEKLEHIDNFIIDCHTCQDLVRPFFVGLGYKIKNEDILFEDGIFYEIISFEKSTDLISYTKEDLEFGPYILKNRSEVFIKRLENEISKNEVLISKINDSKNQKVIKLIARNEYLRGILYEN